MSALLVVKKLEGSQFVDIYNKLLKNIEADFGDFTSRDNMNFYDIWTWEKDNLKIVLSTNRKNGQIKIKYTYIPIANYKAKKELRVKRRGKLKNPAEQMFKDGDFSQRGGTTTGYGTLSP